MKRFLAVIISFGVIAVSVPDIVTPAQATGLLVVDIASIAQSAWQFVSQTLVTAVLASLKKRLIDTMTDEIITWINGGGSPKFITNFSRDVFQPALNQAIGDTVQQILPTLCSPFTFKVNLELTAPNPQIQPSSCTLNSIVSNFNDFYNNFSAGGIIGYSELLAPQNNQYGVDIIAQDALYNNAQQQTQQNTLQTQVNVGFKPTGQCLRWNLINTQNNQKVTADMAQAAVSSGVADFPALTLNNTSYSPDNPPTIPADVTAKYTVKYSCADLQTTTPGTALAEGLNKSLFANIDLVANDQDITNALAMIADAAFNRLIKTGVSGLQSIIKSATSGGGSAGGETGTGTNGFDENGNGIGGGSGIPASTTEAIGAYTNAQNAVIQSQYLVELNQASSSLADASTTLATASSTNQTLIGTLGSLKSCVKPSSPDYSWADGNLTIAESSTPAAIQQVADQVSASTTVITALISTVQTATATTLNQINPGDITNAAANANSIDSSAQAILAGINSTLGQAQTKLTQCQAGK